jgi:2-amino-4-hydroxy-6-hydroxymethyldihydropteridine diphosphokinase
MSDCHLIADLSRMPTQQWFSCAIALGSNLGDCQQILVASLKQLSAYQGIRHLRHSHWYETLPVGPPQPNYLNGCAILETNLSPQALLAILLSIEEQFGRVRKEPWRARTLDLDLLLYDQWQLTGPNLNIPHPRMRDRAFVLIPLAEIAPNWIDPVSQQTILELSQRVNADGILQVVI